MQKNSFRRRRFSKMQFFIWWGDEELWKQVLHRPIPKSVVDRSELLDGIPSCSDLNELHNVVEDPVIEISDAEDGDSEYEAFEVSNVENLFNVDGVLANSIDVAMNEADLAAALLFDSDDESTWPSQILNANYNMEKENKKRSDNHFNVENILYNSNNEASWPVEMFDLVDENKDLINTNKRKIAEELTDTDMTKKIKKIPVNDKECEKDTEGHEIPRIAEVQNQIPENIAKKISKNDIQKNKEEKEEQNMIDHKEKLTSSEIGKKAERKIAGQKPIDKSKKIRATRKKN